MERICGNCGTEMEKTGDNQFYCPKCDETFTVSSGKQYVEKKPNTIERLKKGQANLNDRLLKVESELEVERSEAFPGF